MIKKIIIAAIFAITPLAMSAESSADHCRSGYGYRTYRAPVVRHGHHHGHGSYYGTRYPAYGTHYGSNYGSRYNSGYRYGYGGYGGPYYGRGSSIGINRGGVSLYFGF